MIESEPESYKKWIQSIKHLSEAGIEPAQPDVIKNGADPIDSASERTSQQSSRVDVNEFTPEDRHDQE